MTSNAQTAVQDFPFRFVWRNRADNRWHSVNLRAFDAPSALTELLKHFQRKKKPLGEVVVDHAFYQGTNPPATETPGEPYEFNEQHLSLRDMKQPFHYEYANLVYAPE